MINTQSSGFCAGESEDTIYAFSGSSLRKSTDDGVNCTQIYSFGATGIKQVIYLTDDTLIVFLVNGTTYKSNTLKTVYTLVHTFETAATSASYNFGTSSYGNIVVACEYGTATPPNNARKVYLSIDSGATWSKIYEGLTTQTWHLHSCCYDPYSNLIWITNGDGYISSNIHWSDDMGVTWHDVFENGNCPSQWTGIVALPNCVLFTTDSKDVGVWRWDRLTNVTPDMQVIVEPAYMIQNDYAGSEPIESRIGQTYGGGAACYFGYSFFAGNVFMACKIWETTDGHTFYPLWVVAPDPVSASALCGIYNISDPTKNGNVIATYYTENELTYDFNLVKINNPNWV